MATGTVGRKHVFTLEWRIENFSYILLDEEEFVSSPPFKVFGLRMTNDWNIKMGQNSKEHLYVWLRNVDEHNPILCDWEFSFLDEEGAPIFSQTVNEYNFYEIKTSKIPPGPTLKEVFETKKSQYLPDDVLTLKVRLWLSGDDMPLEDEHCCIRTMIGRDKICLVFNIDDFSLLGLDEEMKKSFHSSYSDHTCTITFTLDGTHIKTSSVRLEMKTGRTLGVSTKVSVLDFEKKSVKSLKDFCRFIQMVDELDHVFPTFLTREEILSNKEQWLDEDVLSLLFECEINVYPHVGTDNCNQFSMKRSMPKISIPNLPKTSFLKLGRTRNHSNTSPTSLMEDFLLLFQERTQSDFEFRCNTFSFPIHKFILAARSPFFRNMFCNNPQKTLHKDSFHDPDLDFNTANRLLTFLYSATVESDLTWEDNRKLYDAAVKYQVLSLKKISLSKLKSDISVLNACDFLILASKHGDDGLRSFVEDFLFENAKEIFDTPQWKKLLEQNVQLGITTMENLSLRSSRNK